MPMELESTRWYIKPNLYACLCHFRDKVQERTLWIDAICIDQKTDAERNEQILLMKAIYENAFGVSVWLGRGSEETRKAMAVMEAVIASQSLSRAILNGTVLKLSDLSCLKSFTASLWWERIWVVQEACLSLHVSFYYGHDWISMKALHNFTVLWHNVMGNSSPGTLQFFLEEKDAELDMMDWLWANPLSMLMNLRSCGLNARLGKMQRMSKASGMFDDQQWSSRRQELVKGELVTKILAMCRNRRTTDPRDKIYGLLGLLPQDFVSNIHPDIKIKLSKVFQDFTITMLTYTKSLTILNQATYKPDNSLPSWVANFELSDEADGYDGDRIDNHKLYNADGGFGIPEIELDMQHLNIKGVLIDKVKEVGIYYPTGHELHIKAPSDPLSAEKKCFKQWRNMCGAKLLNWSSRSRYIAGDTLWNAYWKTLFGGITRDGSEFERDCSDSDAKEYIKWRISQVIGGVIPKIPRYSINFATTGRRLLVCEKGYLGLGPKHSMPGDLVYVVKGSQVPYILRPVKDTGQSDAFTLLGECYIHGIMHGEGVHRDSQNQSVTMLERIQLKIFGGQRPDPDNGRRIFDWITLE